ncbi:MAG: CdaR family protein [Caldicoprobacterales bacterium]|mgnify:CR=1 FL=1
MTRFFERNITLKVISIVIALILWSMTPSNRDPLRDMSFRDIPIRIENEQKLSENGLMISSDMPDTYSFDIKAKSSMVRYIDKSKIIAIVDLSEVNKTGEQRVSVEISGLPSNIEIKSLPDIDINVERIVSKTVPVIPKVAEKDSVEFGKRYYEINPRFVEVRGPESLISTAAYAQISVSLGVKDRRIDRSLMVELFNEEDEIIEPDLITINPEYCVLTVYPNKTVRVDPQITGEPAEGFVVMGQEIKPGEVTISGEPEVLAATDTITTEVLDIQGATGDINKELKLQQHEDIRLSPGEPSHIQVLVRVERIINRDVNFGEVELRNVPQGLHAKLDELEEEMTITVSGPQSLINALKPQILRVYMDLENSSRGERNYPVQVENLPSGLEVTNIVPKQLKVIIE